MAPKKPKTEAKPPATPTKPKAKADAMKAPETPKTPPQTPAKTPSKTPTKTPAKTPSRKSRDGHKTVEWKLLPRAEIDSPGSSALPLQVEVVVDGSTQAGVTKKGTFDKLMRLNAPNAFTVVKTFMITEGENAGHQAILIRPAKPFEFMKLTPEIRNRIYGYYFANSGIVDDPIVVDGKRAQNKQPFAKTYSKGDKNRVALLAASKELNKETTQILYALPLQFDNPLALTDFLSEIEDPTRTSLTAINIKTFQKSTAKLALNLLSQCENLQTLRFISGVFGEADVEKAVKAFYEVSTKFLQAVALRKGGDKDAAVEVLKFGKMALTEKGKEKEKPEPWGEEMVEEFKEGLKAKLK